MKNKIQILLFVAMLLLTSCANEFKVMSSDVPASVISAFQLKYPDVKDTKWEVEKEDGHLIFEAEFQFEGKRKEACFKPDGTFIKEE